MTGAGRPTLYFSPGATSFPAHVALKRAGLAFDLRRVDIHAGEQHSPAFRRLSPRGRVPVLEMGERAITEGLAIIVYADAVSPELGILPRAPAEAARAFEWLSFFNSTVQPAFAQIWRPERSLVSPEAHDALRSSGRVIAGRHMDFIEAGLRNRKGSVLGRLSICDAYVAMFWRWSGRAGFDLAAWPAIGDLSAALLLTPDVAETVRDEGLSAECWVS
jgi:glutathione S-transferase